MKSKLRFLVYIAIAAIITLNLASCDIMKPVNEPGGTPTDTPSVPSGIYTGTVNGATYTLTVYPAAAKAAHAVGDKFTLTVNRANTEKTSSGKLVNITGSILSAQPSYKDAPVITITVSGTQITNISTGSITFNDGSTEKGPGDFTFTNVAVTGVTLAPNTLNLTVGGSTGTLTATVAPSDAANKTVTWSTSDSGVATVNNGVVTAVGGGTATITVSTQDGGKTATCAVTVKPFAVTLNSVTADGSSTQTTTQLTLTFSQSITGLSASDINLSGVSNVSKGTLSGSGPTYILPISGFTSGGNLSVAVSSPAGYNVSGSPKTVSIFAAGPAILKGIEYYWVNEHGSLVTTSGNAVTIAAGATLTITAQSPGYIVRQWHLNGVNTGQSGDTYSFSSTTPGKHIVGLFVEKDSKLYNTNIIITVLGTRSVTIDMYDSRGDGWDGNGALRINVNGVDIAANIKVQTGYTNKYTFDVMLGAVVQFYWVAGEYQDENSFIAYYTSKPPSPAFSPNTAWNGSNALVYWLRGTMNSISDGTLLGSFTVQ